MSSGHHIHVVNDEAKKVYYAALRNKRFTTYIFDTRFRVDRDYDIPYLAGYSKDGRVVYVDRHLPLTVRFGGASVAVLPFLIVHERTEKGLEDCLGLDYEEAHKVATWREHRELLKARRSVKLYEAALDPYIKASQLEQIVKVPRDLDMKPYRDSGDKKLIERMLDKMGD